MGKHTETQAAWDKGDAAAVFESILSLNQNELGIPHGPLNKNQATKDFETLVEDILLDRENVKVEVITKKEQKRFLIRTKSGVFDLNDITSKFDLRVLEISEKARKAYCDYVDDDMSILTAQIRDVDQLALLGEQTMVLNPTEQQFRTLDTGGDCKNLDRAEMLAINIYTGDDFESINQIARGNMNEAPDHEGLLLDILTTIAVGNAGLSKLPDKPLNREMFRYDNAKLSEQIVKARIQSANSPHNDKMVVKEGGFVSTLDKKQKGKDEYGGLNDHRTVVTGIYDGKYIASISYKPEECEYLLPSANFVYLDHKEADGHHYYLAKQVRSPRDEMILNLETLKPLKFKTFAQIENKADIDIYDQQVVLFTQRLLQLQDQILKMGGAKKPDKKISKIPGAQEAITKIQAMLAVDQDKALKPKEKLSKMNKLLTELNNELSKTRKKGILHRVNEQRQKKATQVASSVHALQKSESKLLSQTRSAARKAKKPVLTEIEVMGDFLHSGLMQGAIAYVAGVVSEPYPNEKDPITGKAYEDISPDNQEIEMYETETVINRPGHNLPSTLRLTLLVRTIGQAYANRLQETDSEVEQLKAFVNSDIEMQRLQAAMLFVHTGRKCGASRTRHPEVVDSFHKESAEQFYQYAKHHLQAIFPDESSLLKYKEAIANFIDKANKSPVCVLLRDSMMMNDFLYHKRRDDDVYQNMADHLGEDAMAELIGYSDKLVRAVGDVIEQDPTNEFLYESSVKHPDFCLKQLQSVERPSFDLAARAKPK